MKALIEAHINSWFICCEYILRKTKFFNPLTPKKVIVNSKSFIYFIQNNYSVLSKKPLSSDGDVRQICKHFTMKKHGSYMKNIFFSDTRCFFTLLTT